MKHVQDSGSSGTTCHNTVGMTNFSLSFFRRVPSRTWRATAHFDGEAASDTATVRSDEPSLPGVAGIPVVIFVIGSCLSGADLRWHLRSWSPVHSESGGTPPPVWAF